MSFLFYFLPLFFLSPIALAKYFKTKEGQYLHSQMFFFVLGMIYTIIVQYTLLIDQTWQAFLVWAIPPFILCHMVYFAIYRKDKKAKPSKFSGTVFFVFILWLVFTFVYPFTIKQDLAKLSKVEMVDNKLEDTSIEHIPVISYSTAKYKGDKVLGKVENYSLYTIGSYHIQKVGTELYWVAPIEFNGYFSYKKAEAVYYYIKVSAESDTPAELVKMEAKYTPSAWFGNNLERRIREQYPDILIMDASFEPDDNGKAYYAVSYGHYTNFRNGRIVEGIILVDPANGTMKKYEKNEVPKFVDQVFPEDIALDYNTWSGKYSLGLFNYLFSKQGVHIPTQWNGSKEVAGVFTNSGDFFYATDHTNLDEKSTTMVGYSMMNGRTGKFLYYPSVKGLNGKAALSVVEKTFQKDQWKGDQPVLYSIYGANTWILPVIDSNGVYREIALVNAESSKIAHAVTKQEVFEKYRVLLVTGDQGNATPTNDSMLKTFTGKVIRVVNTQTSEGSVQRLLIEGSDKIFSINTEVMPYSLFTKEGDQVELKYIDSNDKVNVVKSIKNTSLPVQQ